MTAQPADQIDRLREKNGSLSKRPGVSGQSSLQLDTPAGLAEPGSTCFILTNTRSLPEHAAVELTTSVAGSLFTLGQTLGAPVEVVSRSDSTLRGHVLAEMQAIDAARRRVTGTGFDGVLLVPAYFEAGRFTAGDIHWANVAGEPVPVGDSEFAKDATFGYTSSNLRDFAAEKSGGTITADQVHSISLTDIREGGPDRVAEILDGSPAARSSWSTPPTTPTWRSSSSAGCRRRSGASRSYTAAARRSPVLWPGSNPKARSPRRRSGRPVVPAGTGWWSSVRMSA